MWKSDLDAERDSSDGPGGAGAGSGVSCISSATIRCQINCHQLK